MEKINKIVNPAKAWYHRNKFAMGASVVLTGIGVIALQHQGIKSLNQFLEENDLLEAYYALSEEV